MGGAHGRLVGCIYRTVAGDVPRPVVAGPAVGVVAHPLNEPCCIVNQRDRRELMVGEMIVSIVAIGAIGVQNCRIGRSSQDDVIDVADAPDVLDDLVRSYCSF